MDLYSIISWAGADLGILALVGCLMMSSGCGKSEPKAISALISNAALLPIVPTNALVMSASPNSPMFFTWCDAISSVRGHT